MSFIQNRIFAAIVAAAAFALFHLASGAHYATAQTHKQDTRHATADKFQQLEEKLPTPNAFRTASGSHGKEYWQQRADYVIDVELADKDQRIIGSETITYHNHSPDTLTYLWLQLDANIFRPDADANLTYTVGELDPTQFRHMESMVARQVFDGGVNIRSVQDEKKAALKYKIVKTMMRIDLPAPLRSGMSTTFSIAWDYKINNSKVIGGRTGYEFFPEDGNHIYEIAQWFPRMCAYSDSAGWQHNQYLGRGEFALEFGDYLLRITAPEDHIVASTGLLMNADDVLTESQRSRLEKAKTAKKPLFVVTPEEAKANEKSRSTDTKTWIFKADNVRDVAFASSRKFIWDAMGHDVEGNQVMAMSFYPKEAEPLWSKYSTQAIVHTLNVYSRYTFAYPYPVAISVNGPVFGMEYPMICFNGPRPEADGTYSKRTKYGLISVVIHEVGHNYFPMIVNSDERQWTWMDEGLNSFLQYLAEQEWEEGYPSRAGNPQDLVEYMQSPFQVPIMTHSDSILQFGANGYFKPATALNVLRETVLGREKFDFAFKEYARRWKFKRPMPADFFRTMEDASGVDLDWFWRGWFYTTDHCDIAITNVTQFNIDTMNPDIEKRIQREERDRKPETISEQRNRELPKRVDQHPELKDFYNEFDPLTVTKGDKAAYQEFIKGLEPEERALLKLKKNFYVVHFENRAGLVMPLILQINFADKSSEEMRIPAEIWRRNSEEISKVIITEKEVVSIVLDPHLETPDIDLSNNHFPPRISKSRFKLFRKQKEKSAMQKAGLGIKQEEKPAENSRKKTKNRSKEKKLMKE